MATSKRKKRPSRDGSGGQANSRGADSIVSVLLGTLISAGIALASALVLALIFAVFALRGEDPSAKAPFFGLVTLAVSSMVAGAVCKRVTQAPTLICAALGAAITVALFLVSLIPALPQVCLPLPKGVCAMIPVMCVLIGAAAASPKQGRRRRKR